ncbi:MAG: class I SAM-dependent methyltransferase [Ktedonobacteraceae bacterium]|nr:class I SAM-dependent methyltransferase [Ktedonobacteraceae bacterium]
MNTEHPSQDFTTLNQEVQDIWNQNAAFWDEQMGHEGNVWHRELIRPAVERLLKLKPGELALEVACGNGLFSRHMAQLGAQVVATDFSEKLIELAKARTTEHPERIEYRVIDATNEEQLLTLGKQRFDAAVCNMSIMDMSSITPLLSALSQLLKVNGRFVFSILHPCFNNSSTLVAEQQDKEGEFITTYAVKVAKYLGGTAKKGVAIIGQPTTQYYFDRPLHVLFNACFDVGFMLDGLEEPAFEKPKESKLPLNWSSMPEIPPILAARLRLTTHAFPQ